MAGEVSSQLLAYKLYVRKYLEHFEKTRGAVSDRDWLALVAMIDNDYPNGKVHPGSVILAACQLSYLYGKASGRSAVGAVDRIVQEWDRTTGRVRVDPFRTEGGIILPRRLS